MRARSQLFFQILFVSGLFLSSWASQAAKETPSPNLDEPSQVEPALPEADVMKKSMDVASPPPSPPGQKRSSEFYYPFRHSITVRGGVFSDTKATADNQMAPSSMGVEYQFVDPKWKSLEVGADLLSDNSGVIHAGKRFEYSKSRFRPYIKAGLGIRIDPEEQLTTFLKFENYQIRAAAGFEQLVRLPASVRAEIECAVSTRSQQAALQAGVAWAW